MLTHPSRRVAVIALSTLAMSLGMAFTPALFAQRVAENQRRTESLKTLTLSGKGGTSTNAEPRGGSRPGPLTQVQKEILYKGATVRNSFTLSPNKPVILNKAWLKFKNAEMVDSSWLTNFATLPGARNNTTNYIELSFKAKVGRLYVLDFNVFGLEGGTFTVFNPHSDSAQTIPTEGFQHVTAYVMAEGEWLHFRLSCTGETWTFFSVEVTPL